MYKIVESNIGRAGSISNANRKKIEWDKKYGEGNWLTGYEFQGRFLTREEAIEEVYNASYFKLLDESSALLQDILMYEGVFNPHAHFTNSVDLQAKAIETYLNLRGFNFKKERKFLLATGVWQPKNNKDKIFNEALKLGIKNNGEKLLYPVASYKLSPFKVMCIHNSKLSVEEFWQSPSKSLAVKIN